MRTPHVESGFRFFLRRLSATIGILAILALAVLAVRWDLHERFHADADHADHACAVTQFVHGSASTLDLVSISVEPPSQGESQLHLAIVETRLAVERAFVLPPVCGPPPV